mmetsp:Transcript_115160/g.200454  ORF Transcript_115160/g.200454 Transcript_115160/m.200454 type:complete len:94 (+) Transcript_115160:186-467(+)
MWIRICLFLLDLAGEWEWAMGHAMHLRYSVPSWYWGYAMCTIYRAVGLGTGRVHIASVMVSKSQTGVFQRMVMDISKLSIRTTDATPATIQQP